MDHSPTEKPAGATPAGASQAPGKTSGPTLDLIAEEHAMLRRFLGELVDAPDVLTLPAKLDELLKILQAHFEREEAPDGFTKVVEDAAPHQIAKLELIVQEHRTLLAQVEALRWQAQACLDGPVAEILNRVQAFARALREHEHRETDLLTDAIYTDIGGGD
jgi:hypothetical protein